MRLTWVILLIHVVLLRAEDIDWAKRDEEFTKYFQTKATVIPARVALSTEATPIIWPQMGDLQIVNMTVVFQTSGRTSMLSQTLASFFKYNTYPLSKIVAIHDGEPNQNLLEIIDRYPNITWIIANIQIGQLSAIDQAYKHIETDYFFHTEDDWQYIRPGFIEYCLQALKIDPKLTGVHTFHGANLQSSPFVKGPLRILTELQLQYYSGYSFWPSAHRMADYRELIGGYTGASFNESYAMGVGNCESFVSIQYTMKGRHYAKSELQFVLHSGANKGSPVKFFGAAKSPQWERTVNRYGAWRVQNHNKQKLWESLSYLDPIVEKLPNLGKIITNPAPPK